jgi:biopolymer transport protein ExbD
MGAGTLGGSGRSHRTGIVGINVTPMVDVVLVLLVIMMVSANYIASQAMNVDLPKAANSDGSTSSLAAVQIARDGSFRFNDEPVTEAALRTRLAAAFRENADVSLIVSADSAAAHGVVVRVMDLAKAEGITKFAIGVELPDGP